MAQRLYKSKEERLTACIIDDRHEVLSLYGSNCANCIHFEDWDYFCAAYPDGIPDELLSGKMRHDKIIKGQTGQTVYLPKDEKYNEFLNSYLK